MDKRDKKVCLIPKIYFSNFRIALHTVIALPMSRGSVYPRPQNFYKL